MEGKENNFNKILENSISDKEGDDFNLFQFKDKDNFTKIKNCFLNVGKKIANLSNFSIFGFSIISSGFMAAKYLKSKDVYTEYNGHFNSPRNMLNKRMKYFYMQEALAIVSIGTIFFAGGFCLMRVYFADKNTKASNELQQNISSFLQDDDDLILQDKNIIKLNDYEMRKEKVFDLSSTVERSRRVEKYISNK